MADEEVTRIQEQIKTLFNNDTRLERDIAECNARYESGIRELSQKLDQYANRLPTWATAAIAILTAVCGWSLGR